MATPSRARVLVLPGYGNSGPDHWQSIWEQRHGYERVEQRDWDRPVLADWLDGLERAVTRAPGPVVLVAHSLGCVAVAHFAARPAASQIVSALCVAPADVDSELHTPDDVRSFAPLPVTRLPFRTIVVASRTDPYMRFARTTDLAEKWGARLVDMGRQGHLNADAGIGDWPDGHALLEELLAG